MKIVYYGWVYCLLLLLVACSDQAEPGFKVEAAGSRVTVASTKGAQTTIRFQSVCDWSASCRADWLTIDPISGPGGKASLVVTVQKENYTDQPRTATLVLQSGQVSHNITLEQPVGDFIKPEQEDYLVSAIGGALTIKFTTNMASDAFKIYADDSHWISQTTTATKSRTVEAYEINLTVQPNPEESVRTAYLTFVRNSDHPTKADEICQVSISQRGTSDQQSTDFSADKQVRQLQAATQGKGIPIVLMGDGFIDKRIADGTYDRVMNKACENIFSEEPLRSLRSYFDVYVVTAVSHDNACGKSFDTVFDCELEGGNSSLIMGNDDEVERYVKCVKDIEVRDALAVVILNSSEHAGTTYFGFTDASGQVVDFAVAYCPVITDLNSEVFRQVLVHEAVGHGFGKLADEYFYDGTVPSSEVRRMQEMQQMGWMVNVDFTADPTKVLWHSFLTDSRYAEQGLGVFEGACTYRYGAYRPTDDSMMGSNTLGFNAPSRKAICDQTLELSGESSGSYESFVAFDQTLSLDVKQLRAAAGVRLLRPFAAPVWTNRPLKMQ